MIPLEPHPPNWCSMQCLTHLVSRVLNWSVWQAWDPGMSKESFGQLGGHCLRGHQGRIPGCPRDPLDSMGTCVWGNTKGRSWDVLQTAWAAVWERHFSQSHPWVLPYAISNKSIYSLTKIWENNNMYIVHTYKYSVQAYFSFESFYPSMGILYSSYTPSICTLNISQVRFKGHTALAVEVPHQRRNWWKSSTVATQFHLW